MFKVGQKVIFTGHDNDDISKTVIKSGTVSKVGRDTVWLEGRYKAEDQVYSAFLYPDIPECRQLLEGIVSMGERHKKEGDEMTSAVYKMNNDLIRRGLK
jgi:hypothetical protein